MSSEGFLKLTGITNDGQIDVMFELTPQPDRGAASPRDPKTFTIVKGPDSFSAILFHKCVDGSSILAASVTLAVPGSDTAQIVHFFGNLLVDSFSVNGGPDDPDVTETVGFSFDRHSVEFTS
jgi:hypothetical protein